MQKARQEANDAFKNISLGQKRKSCVLEKKTRMPSVAENAKRRVTRLERCKLEAQNAFGNVALSNLGGNVEMHQDQNNNKIGRSGVPHIQTAKKSFGRGSLEKIKKEKRKSTSKAKLDRRSTSRRRSSNMIRRRSSTKGSRLTKVKAAQLEALESFGGQSLDKVWKFCKKVASTGTEQTEIMNKEVTGTEGVAASDERPITADINSHSAMEIDILSDSLEVGMVSCNVKNSCQENTALVDEAVPNDKAVEFSSKPHCQLVDESTQIDEPSDTIELHSEDLQSNEATATVSIVAPCDQPCDCNMHSRNGMSPIPEQSPQQSSIPSDDVQCSSAVHAEPKPLTRLEKARFEALQSFHGQAFDQVIKSSSRKMAKYLTPVKHQSTNTEASQLRNTPSQTDDSYCKRHPRPRSSFYTRLRDNSFCDRDALLESSKMVVLTARTLDTPSPDCSPANSLNP